MDTASRQLEASIKENARSIRDKYIVPPLRPICDHVPAHRGAVRRVTRRAELCTVLQRDYRVTIMGPTTLGAFLNSLQMGFHTHGDPEALGRGVEDARGDQSGFRPVWGHAGGDAEKSFPRRPNNLGKAAKRTEIIQNKLRSVEELPETERRRISWARPLSL